MNETKTLYTKDAKGNIRVWSITPQVMGYVVEHGIIDGAKQRKTESIFDGKQNRTREQQIEQQINSAIKRQRDKGYVDSIEEAQKGITNSLGLFKPMLAQKVEDNVIDFSTAYVQRKYDGNRCIIGNDGSGIKAYSRGSQFITSIDHILDSLDLEPGTFIDGELYCHGVKLQTIASWIKRKQHDTLRLKFHAYDTISNKMFRDRFADLKLALAGTDCRTVEIAPTYPLKDAADLQMHFNWFRADGYEGAIVRHTTAGYEDGKRSKSLLKVKAWHDAEFMVVDIARSKDGWALLHCVTPRAKSFSVTCHGPVEYKIEVFQNAEHYIGKYVTVEYAYLTAEGIPFHPVAKCWREE